MSRSRFVSLAMVLSAACGGSAATSPSTPAAQTEAPAPSEASGGEATASNQFQLRDSDTAGDAHGATPSEIEATETETAMRFFVIDKESGQPIEDIVIKMTAPDGEAYYTWPTDSVGYGEVLVPAGQSYELEYLSLGHRNVTARVDVPDEPNQDLKLTLRFKRYRPPEPAGPEEGDRAPDAGEPRVVLEGVRFDTGQATLRPESLPRLDRVVEYLSHKPSARLRVAGHTDNVGRAEANRELSQRRAEAVRDYLVDQGIDGVRIEAVGYGAERPIAPNDTEEGRQKNRRIEAVELRDGQ